MVSKIYLFANVRVRKESKGMALVQKWSKERRLAAMPLGKGYDRSRSRSALSSLLT